MIDNNDELTICELDAVNGGFIREIISMIKEILKSPEPHRAAKMTRPSSSSKYCSS